MKDGYTVTYSPAAYEDLEGIYEYIAFKLLAEQAARGQVNRIRNAIRRLGNYPEKYERVEWEPWFSMAMRRMPVDRYMVFYNVNEEEKKVVVVRVIYGGRDIETMIKRESEIE